LKTDRKTIAFATILPLVLLPLGCTPTRVVMVPPGQPVRLAESVKARVWAKDASGNIVKSRNRVTIHEGWYALPKE